MNAAELATRFNIMAVADGLGALVLVLCAIVAWSAWSSFKQNADLMWLGAFVTSLLVMVGSMWEDLVLKDNIRLLNPSLLAAYADTTRLRLPFAAFQLVATLLTLMAFRARRSSF